MDRIEKVAERAGIDAECLDHYGKYIAKLPLSIVDEAKVKYFDKQKLTLPAEEMQAIADAIAKEM